MCEGFTLVLLYPFRSPDSCSLCGVRKSWSGIRKYESRGEGKKDLFSVHCNMLIISALSSGVKGEGDSRK